MTSDGTTAGADDGVLPLEGGQNFRDIGGHQTADGRRVRRGLVFRSGTMATLSDADHALIERLSLVLICDFRSTRERSTRPSRLPRLPGLAIWSRDHESSTADIALRMQKMSAGDEARVLMIEVYRDIAYEQAPSYREFFARLAAGDLPLAFHCSAGKDRTGVAAALLLELLGVPRETILADYVFTDRFIDTLRKIIHEDPAHRLSEVDAEIVEPMLRADPDYLLTMFEVIDERHGGAEGFIRDELGLDDEQIAAIRARLLD